MRLGCLSLWLSAVWLAAPVSAAMPCQSPQPAADHPALAALSRAHFEAVPQWQSLTAAQRDLLVRVSLLQRDRKASDPALEFRDGSPEDIAPVAGARPGARMRTEAAAALGRLLADGRIAGRAAGTAYYLDVGDTLRPYETQRQNWSVNLKRYLMESEPALRRYLLLDGNYSDQAVCKLRDYASVRYAFPGFSNHQQGLAVDLHAREGDGPPLVATTAKTLVGTTGLTNIQLWCRSRTFAWLAQNARRYGFVQVTGIDEPWHWEWRPALANDARRAAYISESCGK